MKSVSGHVPAASEGEPWHLAAVPAWMQGLLCQPGRGVGGPQCWGGEMRPRALRS